MNAPARDGGVWMQRAVAGKLGLVLLVPLFGSVGHTLAYAYACLLALLGPRQAVEALTLGWLLTYLNTGVYSLSPQTGLLRWAVLLCAFLSVARAVLQARPKVPPAWWACAAFCAWAGLMVPLVSAYPDVSLLKLVSFFLGSTTILFGYQLTSSQSAYWRTWSLGLFITVVMLSMPLMVHELGYYRNGRGFQGLLNHPQAFGIFLGPFVAWALAELLGSARTRFWLLAAIAAGSVVALYATQARTGVLSALIGVTAGFWATTTKGGGSQGVTRWFLRALPLAALAAAFFLVRPDESAARLSQFLHKGQEAQQWDEIYASSRGDLTAASWSNFVAHPLTGIGFGVPSDQTDFSVSRDPVFGLPLGASVEKGFTVTAVLEEVGAPGFLLFLMILVGIARPALRAGPGAAAVVVGALAVNVGEAVFFSLGGFGMFVWIVLAGARHLGVEGGNPAPRTGSVVPGQGVRARTSPRDRRKTSVADGVE